MDSITADETIIKFLPRPKLGIGYYRVYYHLGNFFMPLDLPGCDVGAIKGAINRWKKDSINAARLKEDRARPTYRTLMDMHADGPSD